MSDTSLFSLSGNTGSRPSPGPSRWALGVQSVLRSSENGGRGAGRCLSRGGRGGGDSRGGRAGSRGGGRGPGGGGACRNEPYQPGIAKMHHIDPFSIHICHNIGAQVLKSSFWVHTLCPHLNTTRQHKQETRWNTQCYQIVCRRSIRFGIT